MRVSNEKIAEFIQQHAEEINAGDYSHLLEAGRAKVDSLTNRDTVAAVMKILHDVGEKPLSECDPKLIKTAVAIADRVYSLPLGWPMSQEIIPWNDSNWKSAAVRELIKIIGILGIQVYLFENGALNGKKDYLLISPKNPLERVLPFLNKGRYTKNKLEDFELLISNT